MADITITINTDNAAFGEYPGEEVARILRKAAQRVEDNGPSDFPLMDYNGNRVGGLDWRL